MANPRWGLVRTSAIIPQNDFLGADLSPLCTESRLWNPASAQWNPITQAMNFIKKKVEQENRKKKKKIQPSIRRVIESTLCRGAAEYRTVQGSLLNPRQDIHYSHKLPSQQNRRAGFTEREQPSLISCSKPNFPAWYGNPFPPLHPPTLVFPLFRPFSSLNGSQKTCSKWPLDSGDSGGWTFPPWAAKRRGRGFHHLTRGLFARVCALNVVSSTREYAPASL